ncbi:ABC transporter permease [Gryllotalpicola reticulitermitis]|uniref:ABC transporter permease n=1 Tax=Gryllotalpicola reticulitermitis TaxID=1184153 RepID=A0ABV8Q7W9_9MICO
MSQADARTTRNPAAPLINELTTLFRRWRTIALLSALAAVPVLIGIAVRVTQGRGGGSDTSGPAFVGSIAQNGLFVSFTALVVSIPVFLPLTVSVVAGDTIAGEASLGTLRYLLVAPIGRVRLLVVKFIGTLAFVVAAVLALVVFGVLIGAILFHIGPVPLLSGNTVGFGGFVVRLLLLAAYSTVSLVGLTALGLFISTLTSVPVGAMAATVVLAAVTQVADALPQLSWLHPWLFSHYWLGLGDFLRSPMVWNSFGQNALLQLGYLVVFGLLAWARLTTKDILS